MRFPLVLAVLASLTLVLLPALDHFANSETNSKHLHADLTRLARWVQK
jgi:hypothetical protein